MTKRIQWSVLAGMMMAATQLSGAAPDYFRLEPGSVRVYRAHNSEQTFAIRVGAVGFMHNEHVHYPVQGYANQPLRLYRDERTGSLYHLDPDTEQDVLVTSAERGPGWFQANFRECDQEGRVQDEPATYMGPAGWFTNATAVQYRAFGCNDTGVESEVYVDNIGLVQRTLQTFAGPIHYDLVYAAIGSTTITEAPSSAFSVSVREGFGPLVIADLRFNAVGQHRVLQMPTSQDYEVVLRDQDGREVWRYSFGKFFTPGVRNISARQLNFSVEIPLQIYGILLHEGVYTVEAWLMTNHEREFAASTQFTYTHPAVPGEQE